VGSDCVFCGMAERVDGDPCCNVEFRRTVIRRADAMIAALRAENARMREALEFYAERTGTHVNGPVPKGAVDRWAISEGFPYYNCGARDGGKIARAALGGRDA